MFCVYTARSAYGGGGGRVVFDSGNGSAFLRHFGFKLLQKAFVVTFR